MKRRAVSDEEMVAWALAPERRTSRSLVAQQNEIVTHFGVGHARAKVVQDAARERICGLLDDPKRAGNAELMRENRRLQRLVESGSDSVDLFVEAYKGVADLLPAYRKGERKLPRLGKKAKQAATMMADWSDWHAGEVVEPDHVAGLGVYNWDVCQDRMRYLRDKMLIFWDEWSQVRDVPKLTVNVLGDLIDGDKIFLGQEWFTHLDLTQQVLLLVDALAYMLRDLAIHIPEIEVFCVPGNHGRAGGRRRKEAAPPGLNNETIMFRLLQAKVSQLDNVTVYVTRCPWLGYQLYKRNHFLIHGQATQSWNQMPWYGLARDTMKYVAMTRVFWDVTHCGHFHQSAEFPVSSLEVYANGSMVGANLHSAETIKSATPPVQRVLLVHPDHGVVSDPKIRFPAPKGLEADERGIYTPVDDGRAAGPVPAKPARTCRRVTGVKFEG